MRRKLQPICSILSLAALAVCMTGCTKMLVNQSKPVSIPPGTPQFSIKMIGEGWSKPTEQHVALGENMTIEDALEACKAKQKFKNMEIDIVRQVPDAGTFVKMPVDYRAKNKKIPSEQNYAIHPNDRIVIKQVTETAMDQFVDSLFPSLDR